MTSEDDVDDAVDYWHDEYEGALALHEFMCDLYGWTEEQYDHWVKTGDIPHG